MIGSRDAINYLIHIKGIQVSLDNCLEMGDSVEDEGQSSHCREPGVERLCIHETVIRAHCALRRVSHLMIPRQRLSTA